MTQLFPLAFISATNSDKFQLASILGLFQNAQTYCSPMSSAPTKRTTLLAKSSEYRFSKAVPRAENLRRSTFTSRAHMETALTV